MIKRFVLAFSALFLALNLSAQETAVENNEVEPSTWSVGFFFGPRMNFMNFNNLSDDISCAKSMRGGEVFSLFAYREFKDGKFGIRPQISLVNRGAKLTGIESKYWENADYTVKAKYLDLRMPVIMNLGTPKELTFGSLQPYIYLTPILGTVRGGEISLEEKLDFDEEPMALTMDVSKANMSAWYLGAGLGAGLQYKFQILGENCYAGAELMFDYGISNTYGKKEKDGKSTDVGYLVNYTNYPISGKRNFSGLEIAFTACVPISLFKHKRQKPELPPIVEQPVIEEDTAVVVEEKPCYKLDEIITLISNGENVKGKTICAINTINFDFGSAKIKPESYDYLDKLAKILKQTGANIKVNGHTDNKGKDAYNLKLSQDRAKSVVEYLVKQGIEKEKLTSEGFGFHRPLTDNDTEEHRAMNRRVEFEILEEESNN